MKNLKKQSTSLTKQTNKIYSKIRTSSTRPSYHPLQRPKLIPLLKKKKKSQTLQGTIDYKNIFLLKKYISAEGKILPRRITKLNAKKQRSIALAIKNARMVGLLPFVRLTP